ncbi:hypothetical protein [Methylorubrum salsuginis]|uniref:Uncharacterized protein n=1 Tax=Methylorubrum salsuginis TaxID=414703 RepID=A0A1I3YGJ2_9HYPH|nr:hypothetical protein [Methylorubrum salsuginis]SFK30988.1 hypothetical protein SAMN04488125_101201 [Methylorubrum salsuginis]
MTAISGSTAAHIVRPPHGGRERIDDRLEQGVSSGTISATDATALSSALDSIDDSLSSDSTGSTGSSARAARPDPAAMKDRIDGLIADQVSAGTLTSDQADTLKALFSGGGDEARGPDGPGGPGGPGGPPPSGAAGSGDTSDSAASDGNAAASKLISDFLSQLQSSLGTGGGYGATGASSGSRTATSLVMDFDA